jgi:conjugative transfer signal peptidase TraF
MRRHGRRYRLQVVLTARGMGTVAAACALCSYLATPSGTPDRARIVWNVTASAPIGLYVVRHDRAFVRGDLVLVVPSPSIAKFAMQRDYLPAGVPLVKRIAAMAGDTVCAQGESIFIDGQFVAVRLSADGEGRPLPSWQGCRTLDQGEVFLLMEGARTSFDGRYFGPTNISNIVGRLDALWTR